MPPVLAACSAFAPDGTSAMATITGDTLELTVAELSGQNSKLTLPLKYRAQQSELDNPASRWRAYDCSLFFNSTSGLVAVGITTESETPHRLQVAVADFRTARCGAVKHNPESMSVMRFFDSYRETEPQGNPMAGDHTNRWGLHKL
jgi:hypothetical protein